MAEQGFESLKVWQKAHQLMLDIHKKLLPLSPKDEKYNLADQVRRSSKSVGANIAEGYGRFYYMDNVRFCYNARGSLDETANHLKVSLDLGYCPKELHQSLRSQADEIRRMLNGYIDWLKAQKAGEKEPGANIHVREIQAEYYLSNENIPLENKNFTS
jgi:four helix bundle protein